MDFIYKARTREGKLQRGLIEASTRGAALDILEKYGLFATSLKKATGTNFLMHKISLRRVSPREMVSFTRQLAIMLKSALPPVEALRAQVAQTDNPSFREKLVHIAEAVERGVPLSESMAQYPKVFDQFFTSIIYSGEKTGKLADALQYLADYKERQYNLAQKVKGALIYPAFVILVLVASLFLVSFFIVPKIKIILTQFGKKLPVSTRALFWFSDMFRAGGWIAVIMIPVILFFLAKYLKRYEKLRELYGRLSLRVPIMGPFYKKIYVVQFAENMSILLKSGISVTNSLEITSDIIKNKVFKDVVKQAKDKVMMGGRMSRVFAKYPKAFPSFVAQMVSTGEQAGRLADILKNVSDFYRPQVERTADNLTTILEPILLLIMGTGVAVLAVSVFIPLFQLGMGGMGGMH